MKHVVTLLMLMAISSVASAQLLKEDFDYPAGDSLRAHGWLLSSSTVNPLKVTTPGLTFTGYSSSGVGNATTLMNTGQDVYKAFSAQTARSVYLSFMMNVSAAQSTGDYFIGLSPSTSQSNYYARLFIKSSGSGFLVGVSKNNEAVTYGTTVFSLNTTYMAVVKYTFVAGTINDSISVYVLAAGTSLTAEPGTAEINNYANATKADAANLGIVTLRQGTASSAPTLVLDGLRIATTWSNSAGGADTPSAQIAPSSLDFGKVLIGSNSTDTVIVKNTGYAPLSITSAASNVPAITVTPGSASVPAQDSVKFAVKYTPTAAQLDSGSVAFVSNAASSPDTVIAKGQGKAPGFSVTPTALNFSNVWKDSTVTDTLFVTNKSTTDHLVIDSVKVTDTLFTISPTSADINVSASDTFLVKFKPDSKGLKSASIVFYHDSPAVGDTVKVSGYGITHEPGFLALPDSLDFSKVLVGKSRTDTVTVKNDGYDSLFITGITLTSSHFTVSPSSARLDSMAVKKFVITFTPAVVGPDSSAIAFASNTAQGTDTVWVRGSGANVSSIADARKDANNDFQPDNLGETFFVAGVVTSPNFQASPKTGYFIQDASAGINLFSYDSTPSPLAVGDSVFVIGKIQQYRGLTEITPLKMDTANIKILKHNAAVPKPKVLSVSEFNLNAEKYEGSLIEIDSLYYSSGSWPSAGSNGYPYYKAKNGSDSVLVFVSQYTQIDGTTQPKDPVNFIGVVSQYTSSSSVYNDGYELMPRDTSDIKPVTPSAITSQTGTIPREFYLSQNYPNPFNPSTTIDFGLPKEAQVRIAVYNILGQRVVTLVDGTLKAGNHMINFNASRLASGVYFYVMQTGEKMFKQKMLLMK